MIMAGGGVKGGFTHGESDELGFSVAKDPVHVHDLQATILHLMGMDHKKLTYRFQGRDYRLTDVHGKVVREVLA
jgi:arylsulfatase A-like enzyme